MTKRIVHKPGEAIKTQQRLMAKNIAKLHTKAAQKQQAHLLCQSLKKSLVCGRLITITNPAEEA